MKRLLPVFALLLAVGCGDGPKTSDPKPADAKPDPRIQRAGGTTDAPKGGNSSKKMSNLKEK
jgi:hypothetical protein